MALKHMNRLCMADLKVHDDVSVHCTSSMFLLFFIMCFSNLQLHTADFKLVALQADFIESMQTDLESVLHKSVIPFLQLSKVVAEEYLEEKMRAFQQQAVLLDGKLLFTQQLTILLHQH